jgi:CHAT domain
MVTDGSVRVERVGRAALPKIDPVKRCTALFVSTVSPDSETAALQCGRFYISSETREPMLQSGVALAGANLALAGNSVDGILFALEAEGLNLDGSELVVLSACNMAQGSLDYSEGVLWACSST